MKHPRHSFASISVLELAAGAVGMVLFAATLTAVAQTPLTGTAPPAATATVAPPPAIGANGRPAGTAQPSRVLADPGTKLYNRCTSTDDRAAADPGDPGFKRDPKAQLMTEEEAKAKGYKAGAHKVSCK